MFLRFNVPIIILCATQIVPGGHSRNWLAGMLLLFVDSLLSYREARNRGRIRGGRLVAKKSDAPPRTIEDARKLGSLLEKSIGVEEYFEGAVYPKSMWISWPRRRIYIGKQDAVIDANWATQTRGIDIDDIAEIRGGQVCDIMDASLTVEANRVRTSSSFLHNRVRALNPLKLYADDNYSGKRNCSFDNIK